MASNAWSGTGSPAVGPRADHGSPMGVPSVRLPAERRVAWADVAGKARPLTARFTCGKHQAAIAWPGSQPGGRPLPPPGLITQGRRPVTKAGPRNEDAA